MATDKSQDAQSSAEHIQQLKCIDQDVLQLLQLAGQALESLTLSSDDSQAVGYEPPELAERQRRFALAASEYFNKVSAIDTGLRREINALATADIIPSQSHDSEVQAHEDQPSASSPQGLLDPVAARSGGSRRNPIVAGGLGNLDIGWLNCKNDNVGRAKEAELWEDVLGAIRSEHSNDTKQQPNAGRESRPEETTNGEVQSMKLDELDGA